jgi:cytochrome P450 family 619
MPSATAEKKITLTRPVHVYYTHVNIEKANDFLLDFGFSEEKRVGNKIYYRGYGPDPFVYCLEKGDEDAWGGVAFEVESAEDLEYASKTLPGASEIYELVDAPGGGRCVSFKDPVDGFPFHLVFGQTMREGRRAETSDAEELLNGNPLQLRFNFVCSTTHIIKAFIQVR